MTEKLKVAKRMLFHELIQCPPKQLSGIDLEIGFLLVKDKHIQKLIKKGLRVELK